MATFADISTEVTDALARTDSTVTDKIAGWVNRVQREAANRYDFNFMRTRTTLSIVDATQSYALPSDFKAALSVKIQKTSSWVDLEPLGEQEARGLYAPDGAGEPEAYTIRGTNLLVWPPDPDASLTLELVYSAWPATLSGTTTNWFTDNAADMLVAGALALGYRLLGAAEDYAIWRATFQQELAAAIVADVAIGLPGEDRFRVAGLGIDYRASETSAL